jgi:uncharacterized protein (TIGR02001 family)
MKRSLFALLAPVLLGLHLPAVSMASEESHSPWHWSPGAAIGTDYVWRGQSLTDGKPYVLGEVKLSHDNGVYSGIWASTIDLGPHAGATAEFDYFVGWAKRVGRVSANVGYLYRQRPSSAQSLDFQEVTAAVSYDLGVARLGAGSYYSWDYFQGGRSIYNYASVSVPEARIRGVQVLATASGGRYDFSNPAVGDYDNVDLRAVAVYQRWEYSIGYSDTNVDRTRSGLLTRQECGPRWRAQVLVMF